jgi:hypothetical protein
MIGLVSVYTKLRRWPHGGSRHIETTQIRDAQAQCSRSLSTYLPHSPRRSLTQRVSACMSIRVHVSGKDVGVAGRAGILRAVAWLRILCVEMLRAAWYMLCNVQEKTFDTAYDAPEVEPSEV